jgi:PAS domain S-box-containing protein
MNPAEGSAPVQLPFFALLPLAACVVCTAFAFAVISRDPSDRINRASCLFMFAPAHWAFFESFALHAGDSETAFTAILISTPGWVFIPPLIVYLIVQVLDEERDGLLRRLTPWLFATSAGFTVLNWISHSLTADVVRTPWGYSFSPGPAYVPYVAFTIFCAFAGLWKWTRERAETLVLEDGHASRNITLGFLAPIVVASFTDAILPIAGIQVPRLGTTCFGFLAVMIVWSSTRRGYMFATPGIFADQILKTLPDGVALVSSSGHILFVNPDLERSIGIDAQRLIGAPIANFVAQPELRIGEELHEVECDLLSATKERMPVSLSSCTIQDLRGRPLGLALVLRDMREVTSLRSRLITSGRLAAVGQLAAGIAHEINNPIAFVRANLSLLREHWTALEKGLGQPNTDEQLAEILSEGEEMIDESMEGIDRAVGIVRDVREFSHAGGRERERADLNELLDRVVRVATPELGVGVTIERSYGDLPLVLCSKQQIKQVFLNLIVNAIHAVGETGSIRLTTRADDHEVGVWIDDDGCGIPREIEDRIFDPFFTTKEVGQGTGLGLSISYEIIRSDGGEIVVERKDGPGARLCVRLPIGD